MDIATLQKFVDDWNIDALAAVVTLVGLVWWIYRTFFSKNNKENTASNTIAKNVNQIAHGDGDCNYIEGNQTVIHNSGISHEEMAAILKNFTAEKDERIEQLEQEILHLNKKAQEDPQAQQVMNALRHGEPQIAAQLLINQAQKQSQIAFENYRAAGMFLYLIQPSASLAAFEQALQLEPNDFITLGYLVDLYRVRDIGRALKLAEQAQKICQVKLKKEPNNSNWQRDASVSLDRIADIQARSNPEAALANYQASLAICQKLSQQEPNNLEWQRDVSVSLIKIADVQARDNPAAALVNYQASLAIRQKLSQQEPNNLDWQRDVSVILNKIADVQARDNPAAALVNYQASLKICQKLSQQEPNNLEWQRDVSVSLNKIADIQVRDNPEAALANYQASLAICQKLSQQEPNNLEWQRDVMVSLGNLAVLNMRMKQLEEARQLIGQVNEIGQTLLQKEPNNLQYQADMQVTQKIMATLPKTEHVI